MLGPVKVAECISIGVLLPCTVLEAETEVSHFRHPSLLNRSQFVLWLQISQGVVVCQHYKGKG